MDSTIENNAVRSFVSMVMNCSEAKIEEKLIAFNEECAEEDRMSDKEIVDAINEINNLKNSINDPKYRAQFVKDYEKTCKERLLKLEFENIVVKKGREATIKINRQDLAYLLNTKFDTEKDKSLLSLQGSVHNLLMTESGNSAGAHMCFDFEKADSGKFINRFIKSKKFIDKISDVVNLNKRNRKQNIVRPAC